MLDLLVIGAGLAGVTAAILAARAGLSVRVITTGMSALHWSPGSIDLLGYLPNNTQVDFPFASLDQLDAAHPLRQVDAATMRQVLAELQAWLAAEGLDYTGHDAQANLWLPSAVGAKRPTWLAPTAQAAARLDDPAPLLIVGFDHFNDFFPGLIADNLRKQGHDARAHTLPLSLLTDRERVINTVYLAEELDDLARVDALAETLRPLVQPGERVVFPAMLGLARHNEVVAKLTQALGAPIAEIPTLPPSVPGLRLHRALTRTLERHGGRLESNMRATAFEAHGQEITWIATSTSARPLRHRARAYLLATGGFLGGGFNSDHSGRAWETLFNLPLSGPNDRGQWFRPHFLDPAGQPIFQAGVVVNSAWQPTGAGGNTLYRNLWAAGNLLAHADTIRTRSHEGLAVASAAAAAQAIIAYLAQDQSAQDQPAQDQSALARP
jgi:glycerol-3-phosphate dehydrogenase subunit B